MHDYGTYSKLLIILIKLLLGNKKPGVEKKFLRLLLFSCDNPLKSSLFALHTPLLPFIVFACKNCVLPALYRYIILYLHTCQMGDFLGDFFLFLCTTSGFWPRVRARALRAPVFLGS